MKQSCQATIVLSSLERVRISWSSAEASRLACLLLLCQGSKWLNILGYEPQLDPRFFHFLSINSKLLVKYIKEVFVLDIC